jgi:hypothetical protein
MKLSGHNNKLETNSDFESQDFNIKDASVIIGILRNYFYQHKIRSMCQEIICNARDAMREVGEHDNAFEIAVPTRLSPTFRVRDFGPGITPDRMVNVFINYGSSTKRADNGQTGGFGVGAKSPFAVTDSFTITTFVDGTKRSYIAHVGVNNQGRLDLISTENTKERNGTEIQVAAKASDIEEFRKAIFRAIYFWEQKPILKGELSPPTLIFGTRVSDLMEVIDKNLLPEYVGLEYGDTSLAVIDGIPYGVNRNLSSKISELENVSSFVRKCPIFHIGNGVLEVTANRENIADSAHTISALRKLASKAVMEVQTHIAKAFGDADDTAKYFATYASLSKDFDCDKFAKFGEYNIQNGDIHGDLLKSVSITKVHCMDRRGRNRVEKITKEALNGSRIGIPIDRFDNLFFSTTVESPTIRNKRVREFFKTKNYAYLIEPMNVAIYNPPTDPNKPLSGGVQSRTVDMKSFDQVVKDLSVKDIQTLTYVDPPRVPKTKVQRDNEDFCYHRPGWGSNLHTTLAKNTQKWFYVELEGREWGYRKEDLDELSDYLEKEENAKICGLAKDAVNMVSGNTNYLPLKDWLEKYKPSKSDILVAMAKVSTNNDIGTTVAKLGDLKDKNLVDMGDLYKSFAKLGNKSFPDLIANRIVDLKEVEEFKAKDKAFGKLVSEEYSLVREIGSYSQSLKEITFYCNAKYKAKK